MSARITDEEIEALRRLEREATPGEWRAGAVEKWHIFAPHPEGLAGHCSERVIARMNEHFDYAADAALIAAARNALPRLLAEIAELQRERDAAQAIAQRAPAPYVPPNAPPRCVECDIDPQAIGGFCALCDVIDHNDPQELLEVRQRRGDAALDARIAVRAARAERTR